MIEINDIEKIMLSAGEVIMDIYSQEDLFVEEKADASGYVSPLTQADEAAHHVIQDALEILTPDIPVLSEESKGITYEQRKNWKSFWCVDPLDGTKEFIKRNGEFTINIALIEDAYPVFGCIYVPVKKELYWADGKGAWMKDAAGTVHTLSVAPVVAGGNIGVVASRSHQGELDIAFVDSLEKKGYICKTLSRGSALKFCLVAAGDAHVYPRFKPTMEWDTAAGQCIIESAGGVMWKVGTQQRFSYNKEDLRNSGFVVSCDKQLLD